MMTIGERIKSLRGGTSREVFASQLGIHPQSLYRYEQGRHKIDLPTIVTICDKLNISSEWLIFGRGPINQDKTNDQALRQRPSEQKIHSITPSESIFIETDDAPIEQREIDLIMIPMVEARLSAGAGSLETSGDIERSYAFRSDFLRRKGNPNKMVLMRVNGDSMQPEIMNKDVVLIDQSKTNILAGQIFAVGFEEAIYLKRIDTLPGRIILKSTNPAYPPVEIQVGEQDGEAFRIIGQVIWCGREY